MKSWLKCSLPCKHNKLRQVLDYIRLQLDIPYIPIDLNSLLCSKTSDHNSRLKFRKPWPSVEFLISRTHFPYNLANI